MSVDHFWGQNAFLSNLWWVSVEIEGHSFPSAENAYQAAKKLDEHWWKTCQLVGASTSRQMGMAVALREDWDEMKPIIMDAIVSAKFEQHPELMARLCEIEGEILDPIEDPDLCAALTRVRDANI